MDIPTVVALQIQDRPPAQHIDALALDPEPSGLVLLPDSVSPVNGEQVAGFRDGSQELRVAALKLGIPVTLARPEGAKPGQYSEHSADWVLPILQGVPTSMVADLIAGYILGRLRTWRASGATREPALRYREVTVSGESGDRRQIEIEGPAEEVLTWLREERGATLESPVRNASPD